MRFEENRNLVKQGFSHTSNLKPQTSNLMKLIVGLGNPGDKYKSTRHNLGFLVIEHLSARLDIPLSRFKYQAQFGQGNLDGEKIVLAMPLTYMNRSGQAVKEMLIGLKLSPDDLLVIHDDLDLPLDTLRIRPQGGAGGHNGLASIISCLDTNQFARIRLGIGRPPLNMEAADYVLSPFARDEWETARQMAAKAAEAVICFIRQDIQAAMNKYNLSSM